MKIKVSFQTKAFLEISKLPPDKYIFHIHTLVLALDDEVLENHVLVNIPN